MLKRSIFDQVKKDLDKKVILLSGPRQCGKTFLSKHLFKNFTYLNFDSEKDRKILRDQTWNREVDLLVFDEIHKMKNWKRWLKGIFDTEGVRPRLLATGSARMDTFRKTGDSLAGRHFLFRLHPFSVKEVVDSNSNISASEAIERILKISNFPEPFLENSGAFYRRWSNGHLDKVIRQDLIELEKVRELKQIEILVDLLSERVGSTVSYSSLAKVLEVSPHTVKKWVSILESLFVVFVVTPHSKNVAKSILKEPKIYFYDVGRVRSGDAAKLENMVACHLLKEIHYLEDIQGIKGGLFYIKNKLHQEVDFAVVRERVLHALIEVKQTENNISKPLYGFHERLKPHSTFQVVKNLERSFSTPQGIRVISLEKFLTGLAT